jgi:autotransporter-associated beta strand protein
VQNPVTVAGLTREDGSPTVSASSANVMTFASGALAVDTGTGTLIVNAFFAPVNGVITKTGTGILSPGTSQSSFAGKWICNAGTLSFAGDLRIGVLPGAADQITLNGGRIRSSTASVVFDASRGIVLGTGGGGFNQTTTTPLTWNGVISGASGGNLTLDGGSTSITVLGGANTYDGNTIINAGALLLGASGVIPDTSLVTLGAAGTKFDLNGFDETVKSVSGSAGTIALGTKTLTINNPNGETYSSSITGTGGGKIVKNGSGKLALNLSNGTFDGGVTVNAGILGIGANVGFGSGPLTINNSVTVSASSTSGRAPGVSTVNLNGDLTFDDAFVATPGTFTWGSAVPWTIKGANRTIKVNTAAGGYTVTINGAIGQDALGRGLIKTGNGVLTLGAVNTYSGDTTVSGGMLQIGGTGTIGDGTGTLHFSGGSLNTTANRTASTSPIANPLDITADTTITTTSTAGTVDLNFSSGSISGSAGTLTFRNDAASGAGVFQPRFSGGSFDFSLPVVINNGVSGTTLLQSFNALGSSQTFSGIISGTGSYKRNASSGNTGGDTIFTAANAYSGGTVLGDGGIGLGINSAGIPPAITSSPIGSGTLTVSPSGNNAKLFAFGGARLLGNAITFTGSPLIISGTNSLELSGAISLGASARTITVDNTASTTISGLIDSTGGGLTKSGAGTLILTAPNTYSSGTTISNGTLVVASLTGSATGSGAVTVASAGTLAGSGVIAGTVDLSGTISPGGSPGTLATASENWNGGGHYLWQINNPTNAPGADPGWDLISITGGLNITAAATNRFTIELTSLTSTNVAGLLDEFDASASNVWLIAQAADGITNFDANAFHIIQTGFSNDLGGQIFALNVDNGTNLVLFLKTNSAPSLTVPPHQTLDELTTLTVTNTATDPDPGTTLTFSLVSPPAGMNISPTSGVLTWTPSEAQGPGSYTIAVVVSDDAQTPSSTTNTFNVTVNEVNSAPSITGPGNQTVNELTMLNVSASAHDPDIPANTLTFSLYTAPAGMSIDSSSGAISWTPAEVDGPGVYTVKVVVTDNGVPSLSATNTFTVTVNEVNSAPLLTVPANQTIDQQTTLNVSASGSDSDLPANILTFSLPSAPATMTIDPNTGAISWTPAQTDPPGVYTIQVAVTDDGTPPLSVTNSFTVTITGGNNPPSVFVPADQTIDELTSLNVSATATDPDAGNSLAFSLGAHPSGMSIVPGTGAISWTPSEAQGPSTNIIEVIVTDNGAPPLGATNAFSVVVHEVNSSPALTVASDQTIDELTSLNVTNTATDPDIPGNTLTFTLGNHPDGMTITADTGIINWTPTEAQGPGSNLVEVIVTDDGSPALSTTNTFVVMVNEVNSAPLLTVPANQTINEQTALNVSASAIDSDLPANALTFSLPSAPVGMTIDPNTGAIGWTPTEADGPAIYTVAVAVTDDGMPPLSTTNTFTVTVNEVNNPPSLFVPADHTIDELTALNVSAGATDPDLPANALVFSLGAHPTGMSIVPATGAISWTPSEAQGPSVNLVEVIVTDDGVPNLSVTNTFNVTVREVNVAPALTAPDDQTIDELVSLSLTNTATDSDIPANTLTFSLGNHPTGMTVTADTGIINWTPTEAQGPSSNLVEVIVTDNGSPALSTTNTFVVLVNEVNSAPLLTVPANQTINEQTALNVSASATDSDLPANALIFGLPSAPAGMTIDPNTGAINWTPGEADGPAVYTISVAVTDDGTPPLSVTNSFTVTVNEVNTPPSLFVPADQTIDELTSLNVSASATDPDLPANSFVFSLGAHPAGMTIVPSTGGISWTPTEAQGPSANLVEVIVTDDGVPNLSVTNTFNITVREVNVAPSLTVPADQTIDELTSLNVTNTATDSDLPANALTFSLGNHPTGMTITADTGIIDWTPTEAQGPSTNIIEVIVTDDGSPALSKTNSFTVTVNEVNSAPAFTGPGDQTINELTILNVSSAATDPDIPANTLTYALLQGPAGMTIDTNTGAITWPTTEADGPSTNTIIVSVTDDGTPSLSATNTFSVVVNEVNTPPILNVPANQTINELATLNASASATDSDLPANPLAFSLLTSPSGMTIVPSTGAITWTPTEAQGPSVNTITVVVTDNGTPSLSATNTFTVTVNEVNSAPSLPAIADRTIHAGQTVTFTNSATDTDLPANTLTYSLDPGAPAVAIIGAASGVFTWSTTSANANTTNAITVRVTDNGTPALDDAKSFTVTVLSPPIAAISVSGNLVTIRWTAITGQNYRVQYKNTLDDASWTDLAPDVTASGPTASTTDTTTSQRFYRVAVLQ